MIEPERTIRTARLTDRQALADLYRRHPTLLDGLEDTFRYEIDRALAGDEFDGEGRLICIHRPSS